MIDVREELVRRTPRSKQAFERGAGVLAAEVVSTVNLPHPFYVAEARGSRITDLDGNEYIDLTMGFGPHLLGHAPDVVVDAVREAAPRGLQVGLHNPHQEPLARLIVEAAPANERVVFASSGTEATMYALRAARAYTGKSKLAIFDGSYHGVHDTVLATPHRNSPREAPVPFARGAGIPDRTLGELLMLPYRSERALDVIREHRDELALVMIESAQSSNPRLDTAPWMRELRAVCRECDVLFALDEVITGFRLAYGGGQEVFGIEPDLATYGKIIGGGLPIGAVAGPREIMRVFTQDRRVQEEAGFAPLRPVFSGTTFAGNPLSMRAGTAQLEYVRAHREEVYPYLREQSGRMAGAINAFLEEEGIPAQLMSAGSMFHLHFTRKAIEGARDVDPSFREAESEFYLHLLAHGVVVPGIHVAFLSTAHTPEDVDRVIEAFRTSFLEIRERGLI